MASADFSRQALLRRPDRGGVREISSGKFTLFPLMQLPHLHRRLRAVIGLRSVLRAYPPSYA